MLRLLFVALALHAASAASAQTPSTSPMPTPYEIPDNAEVAMELKTMPDGSQVVEWRFTNLTIPPSEIGLCAHGKLAVLTIPAGTYFHTWTTAERVQSWVQAQGPSASELDYLVTTGTGMAGGGLYASLDSIDSASFGDTVAVFQNDVPIRLVDFSPITQMYISGEKVLNRFNVKLRDLGISGGLYNAGTHAIDPLSSKYGTWIDFYSNTGLRHVHAGTAEEVLTHILGGELNFGNILLLDQKFPLKPDELLTAKFPHVAKVLRGERLTDEEWQRWFPPKPPAPGTPTNPPPGIPVQTLEQSFSRFLSSAALFYFKNSVRPIPPGSLAFTQALIQSEQDRLREAAVATVGSDKPDFHQLAPFRAEGWYNVTNDYFSYSTLFQIGMGDIFYQKSPFQMPSKLFLGATKSYYDAITPENGDFLIALKAALTYVDFPDLVVAISEGDEDPWSRYDLPKQKSMLERYLEVREIPFTGGAAKEFTELLLQIHRKFSDSREDFRGNDILAGGNLYPDKKGGFYRVNEIEKQRLLDNPFLQVEIKPDPQAKVPARTYLARHRYPSAARFEQYVKYFTPALKTELEAARRSGVLNDLNSAEFQRLNRKMIGEMVDWAMTTYLGDFNRLYQILISIHPFRDYNGRSLRAMSAKFGGAIMLTDWDQDLFLSPPEFKLAVEAGNRKYALLVDALEREQKLHPGFPKYYDLPEWFMIEENIEERPADPVRWVQEQKARWRDAKLKDRVKHKRYRELPQTCDEILMGPSKT